MTEIERLIEVAHIADPLGCDVDEEGIKTVYGKIVRAILQAMREPSKGMLAQMRLTRPNGEMQPAYLALAIWQAGIDHLLSEAP